MEFKKILQYVEDNKEEYFNKLVKVNMEAIYTEKMIRELQITYSLTQDEAAIKLGKTAYYDILRDDPEFVMHYAPSYWVEKLFSEECK